MLSSSAFILSSLFPYPTLSSIHCQEGPCQKGPISVSWQRQRLAAPAASTVSLDFVSGARGLGRAVHTQTDSLQTLERNFHGPGLLPSSPSLPPSRGASFHFHGSFLPKPLMCLGCLMGRKHGGGRRGHSLLKLGAHLGEAPEFKWLPRILSKPACMVEAGGSAWTMVWLLSCISGRVTLSFEYTLGTYTPFQELRMPRRLKDLRNQRSPCWPQMKLV